MIAAIEKPDIISILVDEGIELSPKGRNFWGLCPFHSERTPSFKVDPERQSYYCFSCRAHGDGIQFVMDFRKLSFKEALSYLGIDNTVKPAPEAMHRARYNKRKRDAIRGFRQWCNDYHSELAGLYRALQNIKELVKTEDDAERLSSLYHLELLWIHQLDILEGRDDETKFELYTEVHRYEN